MYRVSPAVWLAPFLVTLVVVVLELFPIARQPGVPAFQQDWVWPVDHSQCSSVAFSSFQPWARQNAGSPRVYPSAWWPPLVAGMLCEIDPHAGLIICLACILMLVGLGAAALARQLGCGVGASCIASITYLANPLILNKLEAGHWPYVAGCGMLAFAAYLALRSKTPVTWLAMGAIMGIGGAQLQFLPMGIAIVWAIAIARRNAAELMQTLLATVVAAAITAPQWLPALIMGTQALDVLLPMRHWELSQSVNPTRTFRLLGYIGFYDARLIAPWVQGLLWLLPAGALAGLIVRRRDPTVWAFAVLAVAGGLAAMGLRGPLAPEIDWTFGHVRGAALFRELYDALALTALGMSVLTGVAIHHARNASGRAIAYSGAGLLAAACVVVAARTTVGIPMYAPSNATRADIAEIARVADDRRYLPYPDANPLATGGVEIGGYSPFSLPIGSHPSSGDSPKAEYPVAYGLGLLREGRRADANRLFERAGIGFVFTVPSVRSHYREALEPALKSIVQESAQPATSAGGVDILRGGDRVVVQQFAAKPGTLATSPNGAAVDDRAIGGGIQLELIASTEAAGPPDPRISWQRTALWPLLPAWTFAEPPNLFTLQSSAKVGAPAAWLVAGSARGSPSSSSCSRIKMLDLHFALLRCGPNPTLRGVPPLVVSSAIVGGTPAQAKMRSGAPGRIDIIDSNSWRVRARVRAAAGSAIVLRETYDEHWRIDVPDLRHVEADGYANAWVLRAPIDRVVTLRYDLALPFFVALGVSVTLVLAGIIEATRRYPVAPRNQWSSRH